MWRIFRYIGLVTGVLSLVLLVRFAFDTDFVSPLLVILEFYDSLVSLLLIWMDPFLSAVARRVSGIIGVDIQIASHWRHIFVLLWLYLTADAWANWSLGRKGFAVFSIVWGGIVAFLISAVVGAIELEAASSRLITAVGVAGIVAFEGVRIVWSVSLYSGANGTRAGFSANSTERLKAIAYYLVNFLLPVILVGLLTIAVVGPLIDLWIDTRANGLLAFLCFVLLLSGYWMMRGAWIGLVDRGQDETWRSRFSRSGSSRLGIAVFQVIAGGIIYLLFNAGLSVWMT